MHTHTHTHTPFPPPRHGMEDSLPIPILHFFSFLSFVFLFVFFHFLTLLRSDSSWLEDRQWARDHSLADAGQRDLQDLAKDLADRMDKNGNGVVEKKELVKYLNKLDSGQLDTMITKLLLSSETNRIALLLHAFRDRVDPSYRHVPDPEKEIAKSEVLR